MRGLVGLAVIGLVVFGSTPSWAVGERLKVGDVRPFAAETPHPYLRAWADRVFSPGAEFLSVHFTGLHLADGDFLTVSSPDGSQSGPKPKRGRAATAMSGPSPSTATPRSSNCTDRGVAATGTTSPRSATAP